MNQLSKIYYTEVLILKSFNLVISICAMRETRCKKPSDVHINSYTIYLNT